MFELDAQFHEILWEIADHRILLEVVSGLRSRISRFLYEATLALPPTELNTHVAGHEDIIELLKGSDVVAAKETITNHIFGAKDRILTYCKQPGSAAE